MTYSFRPITRDDLPLFKDWLANPHIGGWWAEGAIEVLLVIEEIDSSHVDMRFVECSGTPFAFVQDYNEHHWPMPQYSDLPTTARARDTFLDDPAYLGKGHAPGYLCARLDQLHPTYPTIAVDPDPQNTRAVATYTRAGFRPTHITPCVDGDPVQVMVYPS